MNKMLQKSVSIRGVHSTGCVQIMYCILYYVGEVCYIPRMSGNANRAFSAAMRISQARATESP